MTSGHRIALAHEWLRFRHGSEKTFEQMARVFPDADLYALTMNPDSGLDFGGRRVRTTALDRVGPLRDRHALQLPLMPLAWRYATRAEYDVVVTSSHACAKGFRPGRTALHLCYCYTPMRYVWLADLDRRKDPDPVTRLGQRIFRAWDLRSAGWVDEFAAISNEVRERIERIYQRPARVIFPPVDTGFYTPGEGAAQGEFALAVSRLVPYKRLDLAIRACHRLRIPLKVAGWGPQEAALGALAAELGAEVEFFTSPSDEQLRELYRAAQVCLFPAEEDFGIVAVEAQACGTPVVALGRGGSLDTVVDRVTGVHIPDQSTEALTAGIRTALELRVDPQACRAHAERFSEGNFRRAFEGWVTGAAAGAASSPAGSAA
ncbi:MAG TPA: glycosyltransferase [Actinomycetota bacterium]|nr:glycosyltransferase [Actinomycetota bacterium]